MNKYKKEKERARQMAINWQYDTAQKTMSYNELMEAAEHFEKLAKRYGLLKEFKENGII